MRRALSAIVAGATFTGAYQMYWAASLVGFVPASLVFKIDEKQRFGMGEGWIQVQFFGVSALAFVVPFLISGLVTYRERRWAPVPRTLMWLGLCLTLCGAVLSGRKALILVIGTTPLVLGILLQFLPRGDRGSARFRFGRMVIALGGLASVTLVALTATGRFDWRGFLQYFLRSFSVLGGKGDDERTLQYFALLREWADHPLLGHGWGHGARSLVRSDRPWEYELQYVLILFSTGLIGTILYAAGVAWTFVTGVRVIGRGGELAAHMIGLLVGLAGILIANATNPYLVSPGNMWMVFLPVALINLWLLGEGDALPARSLSRPVPSPRGGPQPLAARPLDPAAAPTPS
jgi:O-antigen ligase